MSTVQNTDDEWCAQRQMAHMQNRQVFCRIKHQQRFVIRRRETSGVSCRRGQDVEVKTAGNAELSDDGMSKTVQLAYCQGRRDVDGPKAWTGGAGSQSAYPLAGLQKKIGGLFGAQDWLAVLFSSIVPLLLCVR